MNSDYWAKRQAEDMHHYIAGADEVSDQIAKAYLKASRYLSLQADEIFERFQTKYGLSEAEARRLLNTMHDKTSLNELLEKLRNGDQTETKQELLSQLESGAYRARIERLEQLQVQLDQIMQSIYQQEKALATEFYIDLAEEAYYRGIYNIQQRAGVAASFTHIDRKQIDKVVASQWSGRNYSTRIWNNTQALAQEVKEELLVNLITGRTNREVADIISYRFAQGAGNARRLVWTESSYLANEMNFQAYKECEIEKYRYLATLDLRTCTACCRPLDNHVFLVQERSVGVNFPPMHPWCRCTTISVIDEKLLSQMQRRARDPVTGKTYLVPASMTYQEWYGKYVKNDGKTIEKGDSSGIITSGARITDIFSKEAEEFAEMYYEEIRSFSTDTKKIAEHLNKDEADIRKIKAYLFENDSYFDSDTGKYRRFDPDCAIAQSWQRLMIGKDIKPHDRTLIEHELLEMKIKEENPTLEHWKAHEMAAKVYDYPKEADEYYGNLEKHNKNRK